MCASHAYVSLDTPVSPHQLPIFDAIRDLAGMANQFAEEGGTSNEQKPNSVTILVDAEVDGARYMLVRMPRLDHSGHPGPVTQSAAADETPGERRHKFGDLRRVLIAESDSATRLRLLHLLREWGFNSEVATDGIEALMFLEQHRAPDLLIMNQSLPAIDGIELCRRITRESGGQSPYIFITGCQNGRRDVAESLESGASEYLSLPFEEQELKARLLVALRALTRQDSLISSREQLRDQASRDSLTGVSNRRAILEFLEEELVRAGRNVQSTGVLMLDLDHFKRVNDALGHPAGDLVLQQVVRRLSSMLRAHDRLGRYGGEEFMIVVPAVDQAGLCELTERIRAAVDAEPFHAEANEIQVTLSIGAAISKSGDRSSTKLIATADEALYKAKNLGRNRVVCGI
ncbi:Response regulator receiver modulated diguanylate cyclase (modular protein) [Candidatus Sulfotelmatomonas gaucii]|uniref:diguanylate cyclase n=1 Tax=Candidatus Sulfuritelmatomonas gaucii TaxID=2043161 RepID=A0A2N9LVQ6_9BACT|nr:Response regulator receiver modulated diguanylate cyclase (modular protein) [Candidatus Sulfotelmatomonas gaucii]